MMIHVLMTMMAFVTLLTGEPKSFREEIKAPLQEWKILNDSSFSILYPAPWELNQTKNMGTSFILFARGISEGKFRENVNLMIQHLPPGIDLNKYVEVSEQQIRTMLANAKIIESKRIKTATDEYHEVIYSGDQGIYKLKWKQYYWVIGNQAYALTFTAAQDTYSQYILTADKVLNSFKIKRE